jgi:hypothetical protein
MVLHDRGTVRNNLLFIAAQCWNKWLMHILLGLERSLRVLVKLLAGESVRTVRENAHPDPANVRTVQQTNYKELVFVVKSGQPSGLYMLYCNSKLLLNIFKLS